MENCRQSWAGCGVELTGDKSLLKKTAAMSDKPIILVQLKMHKFQVRKAGKVRLHRRRLSIGDLEDPPVRAINLNEIMAFAGIGPIRNIDPAIRPVGYVQPTKPLIVGQQEIGGMVSDIARSVLHKHVPIDAMTMPNCT